MCVPKKRNSEKICRSLMLDDHRFGYDACVTLLHSSSRRYGVWYGTYGRRREVVIETSYRIVLPAASPSIRYLLHTMHFGTIPGTIASLIRHQSPHSIKMVHRTHHQRARGACGGDKKCGSLSADLYSIVRRAVLKNGYVDLVVFSMYRFI